MTGSDIKAGHEQGDSAARNLFQVSYELGSDNIKLAVQNKHAGSIELEMNVEEFKIHIDQMSIILKSMTKNREKMAWMMKQI